MPIKPENKHRYPENWAEIRANILKRAGDRCEFCGIPNHEKGYRDKEGKWYSEETVAAELAAGSDLLGDGGLLRFTVSKKVIKIVLTVAHLDHTPENNEPGNLRALCQRCHNKYDNPKRLANRNKAKFAGTSALDL
jgi:5-methylcytosine-specific restriction endonuclease McrA